MPVKLETTVNNIRLLENTNNAFNSSILSILKI